MLLKRGETFYGQLIVSTSGSALSPIVIAGYGTGANPAISGFVTLASWVSAGNGLWKASNSSLAGGVNMVTLDGQLKPMGRFPNADAPDSGFLYYENHLTNTEIFDNQLPSAQNWAGAELVIRKNRWIIDRAKITQHIANSLTYTGSSLYEAENNFGYFIQGHPGTLDQPGEWYYNRDSATITLFLSAGNTPATHLIKASTKNTLIQIWNQKYIQFIGLTVEGSNDTGFDLLNTSAISIRNCSLLSNTNSIKGTNNSFLWIDNSAIINSGNNGIFLSQTNKSVLSNNRIRNTGKVAGAGLNGDDTYQALIIRGSSNLIEKNTIDSSGYTAVRFEGDSITIQHNYISNFCLVKDDGGGIYSWNGNESFPGFGSRLVNNMVIGGTGAGTGTSNPTERPAHGIYMDDNTSHCEISGNTVALCAGSGLFLHNAHHMTLTGNTSFNNDDQLLLHQNSSHLIRYNTISRNRLFAKQRSQLVSQLISTLNDTQQFSSFDSNYYCRPLGDGFSINTVLNNPENAATNRYDASKPALVPNAVSTQLMLKTYYNLTGWKVASGLDTHSKISPLQISPYTIKAITGSNKFSNSNFSNNVYEVSTWSPSGNCNRIWHETGELDAGCLEVNFNRSASPSVSDRSAYVTMNIGRVDSTKQYVLKFSLQGKTDYRSFQLFLRKQDSPYTELSERYLCNFSRVRTENEFSFSFPISENNAFLVFQVNQADSTFFVDNVTFHETDLATVNPDDYIRFEYNASDTVSRINLMDQSYLDIDNHIHQRLLTLAPWSSVILLKTTSQAVANWPSCVPTYNFGCETGAGLMNVFLDGDTLSARSLCSLTGYRKFTEPTKHILAGRSYPFRADLLATGQQLGMSIWLDKNRNGQYEPGELIFDQPPVQSGSISGNLVIPADLPPGPIGLRLSVAAGSIPTNACGQYGYGETEDYTLVADDYGIAGADLSLAMKVSSRTPAVGQPVSYSVTLRNSGPADARRITWQNQLPPSMSFVNGESTVTYNGTSVSGSSTSLASGQSATYIYQLKTNEPGVYFNTAQILSSDQPDPDSQPGSGTGDGQDDAASVDIRTQNGVGPRHDSPNPNQVLLPAVLSSQPVLSSGKADLSLQMSVSKRTASRNEVLSVTLTLTNQGGSAATNVQLVAQLPAGLSFETGADWSMAPTDSRLLTTSINTVNAGSSVNVVFQVRAQQVGQWFSQAQISTSRVIDPDSTAGNGYANGEDDVARVDLRIY